MTNRIDVAALLLRLSAGIIFIPHGWSKVLGDGGAAAFAADMPNFGIPAVLGYVAAYAELFGAILLLVGLFTRLDAFLLACTMLVAVVVVQLPDALNGAAPGANRFFEAVRGTELPHSLFALTLAIVILGPGRFSLDSLLRVEERIAALLPGKKKAATVAAAS